MPGLYDVFVYTVLHDQCVSVSCTCTYIDPHRIELQGAVYKLYYGCNTVCVVWLH